MISNTVRFLILLLLVNVICGSYATSNDNRRFYQLLKPRSSDNNNEYVWFTRDVHNDININEMKQDRPRKIQNLFSFKSFNKIFDRKYPLGENIIYEPKDIHDDMNSGEKDTPQEQQLSPQKIFRMKMLKNIFNRKYQNNDEFLSELKEKF
ncbi:unnamed protein product [Rotaria sp. Silwood1]|nr:unnamed protein product [Rotaria sp. Silwood1]CAF4545080.1 unnamed protein product [Rotaria sp. Silwood1]